jgi:hypothetical protein
MRWPFNFRKASPGEGPTGAEPAPPPRRRDWESLQPIQRAYTPLELTAPSAEFAHSLAGSTEPAVSLEPLGHLRSPEGPSGLIVGLAGPVQTYSDTTELVGRPRPKSESIAQFGTVEDLSPGGDVPQPDSADDVPLPPARHLETIAAELVSPPPQVRLTQAGPVDLKPIPPPRRSHEAVAPTAREPGLAEAPGPLPVHVSLGQSRRRGLGAPIAPGTHVAVQRSIAESTSTEMPLAPAGPEERAAATGEVPAAPAGVVSVQATPASHVTAAPAHAQLPTLLVWRPLEKAVRATEATSVHPSSPPGPAAAHLTLQRSVPAVPPPLRSAGPAAQPALAPLVSATRDLLASRPSAGRAAETESGQAVFVQELPVLSPVTESIRDRPWQPQASTTSSLPVLPSSTEMPALPYRPQTATARTPLVWNVQRLSPADSPAAEPTAGAPSPGEGPSSGSPVMAESPAMVPAAAPAAAVGRESTGIPAPGEAGPAGAGGPGGAPAAGSAPAPHGEKEIYELAHELFPPLMSMLRREVLTERERAGFVTDLR